MRVFICHRTTDTEETKKTIDELLKVSDKSIAILRETEHDTDWKKNVENKYKEVDFVIFLVGKDTFQSEQLKWEYSKAKQLNKRIIGIKLPNISEESILFCQGFQVFDNVKQCVKYLEKVFEHDRQLKLEQYKIMVGSTEKVTEQRLKVNNLFFTITSSILSLAFIIGKTFEFSITGTIGMILLTGLGFLVSFLWEKLINSYGKLNTGKFKVIDKIEKQLRTNMFEDEWHILKDEIHYESNTTTESKVIKRFRLFIFLIGLSEFIYLIIKILEKYPICNN